MQKTIALICSDLHAGGVQRVVARASSMLQNAGNKVIVITLSDSASDFYSLEPRIIRKTLGLKGPSTSLYGGVQANLQRIASIRKEIRKSECEIIVSFVTATNILTLLANFFLKNKVIVSERNDPSRQPLGFSWKVLRTLTYPLAYRVTANSRNAVYSLQKFLPFNKVYYLPNPLPLRGIPSEKEPFVLTVGRLNKQKGHDILLRAFALCIEKKEIPDSWQLKIVGSGQEKTQLLHLAAKLTINKRIEWISDIDPSPLYNSAGVFVLASRHEGASNALLEALAAGSPSIVSENASQAIDFLKNGRNVLIVPNEDVDSLASAIARVVNSKKLREEMAESAKQDYISYTCNENILESWAKVLGFTV